MNELHLFAGAGGGILGGMLLGHTCVCAVEIEPYCRKVLLQRQRDGILPRFPIWDDVRTFNGYPWKGKVDVVCGGFPCQDISCAGSRSGINGAKSGLWGEMERIICEIMPSFVFVENVADVARRGLGDILRFMAKMGYHAKWGVFQACFCGAPHLRKRMFILAYPGVSWKRGIKRHLAPTETWSKQTLLEPEPPRMVDDVAYRVERHNAIGNGQVPAVVKLAWETLSEGL